MIDVAIVRSNSVIYDPRVSKIVKSLSNKYPILALGWNREGLSKKVINRYVVPLKLHGQRSSFGKTSVILHYPLFWTWIFFQLLLARPRIVHACDLDTVIPCYLYKVIFGKKLIFDIFDRFAMANIPKKFTLLYSLINYLEELFATKADALISVSEKLVKSFRKEPRHFTLVMNYPEYRDIDKTISYGNDLLKIVYAGTLLRNRGIERVIAAINDLSGVEFVIAGRITDAEFGNEMIQSTKVKYVGLLQPEDALSLEVSSDVMISLYDLKNPNYDIAMPNKTFEAMMCGVPLITNMAIDVINEIGCGIIVDYDDLNQIKSAIITLRDNPKLRNILGQKGRKAFEQTYNWTMSEEKLFGIYEQLQ